MCNVTEVTVKGTCNLYENQECIGTSLVLFDFNF